jgi:hypothetical protein
MNDTEALDWWDLCKPIREDSNGQRIWQYFAEEVKGVWRYAIVIRFDDGEPLTATVFENGTVEIYDYE